jgi:hypothetical protein
LYQNNDVFLDILYGKVGFTMTKRKILCIGIFLLCTALVGGIYWRQHSPVYPEIQQLEATSYDFGQLSRFFTKMAEKKGAVYAFEVLKNAPIPPNTDMHLLGHVVGDILYKQKGIEGISYCTQDFRNACSHSIVVGYFLAYGEEGLSKIAETCREAPGGSGAYTMCFHGLGHGILAAVDYDLVRTVSLCGKTGTPVYGYREGSECVGGAIMEMISGGFHNKDLWKKQSEIYLSPTDPLLPCTADYITGDMRRMCLEYITPHLVTAAGGSLNDGIPDDDVLRVSFSYCDRLTHEIERRACYEGFGKEFVVLVHNRDIRTIDAMSNQEMRRIVELCAFAGNKKGQIDCLTHALDSLFWGGENDPQASVRFCSILDSKDIQDACFTHLIEVMKYFTKDQNQREIFCQKVPEQYKRICN